MTGTRQPERTWRTWLSEVYAGWTKDPQRGGCAGDPQSWEREIQRRASLDQTSSTASPERFRTPEVPEE